MRTMVLAVILAAQSSPVSDEDLRRRHVEAVNEMTDLRARLTALELRVDEIGATCMRAPDPPAAVPEPPPRFD